MTGLLPSIQEMRADPVLLGWNVSAAVSLLWPLFMLTIARIAYVGENDDNNDNNNYDENGNRRRWWQWGSGNNNNDDGNNNDQRSGDEIPWWYFWGGERRGEPESEGRGALIFVYLWSSLLFVGLVLYGNYVFRRNNEFEGLQGALFMHTNFAFLCLILVLGLGAVNFEGREIEDHGWLGQFSVCVFFTMLFWFLRGIVFTILLRRRNIEAHANNKQTAWYNFMASNNDNNNGEDNKRIMA